VNTVMKVWVLQNIEKFLSSCTVAASQESLNNKLRRKCKEVVLACGDWGVLSYCMRLRPVRVRHSAGMCFFEIRVIFYFLVFTCLKYSPTLKMEAVRSFEAREEKSDFHWVAKRQDLSEFERRGPDISTDLWRSFLHNGRLPVAVVVEFVVTWQCQKSSEPWTQREEYLGCCINPNLKKNIKIPIGYYALRKC
jgi:hypothetical protein